jgi:dipeptidyl aminopeptidase/acylaminoacyl peptidase
MIYAYQTLIQYYCHTNQNSMKHIVLFFSLILCLGSFAQSGILTPENLWKLQRVYGEQVSPDGKVVIYSQKNYDLDKNSGTSHLYSVSLDGSEPILISDGENSVYDAQWRPDGKKIGFLSTKSGSLQLWEMNPDGSSPTQISSFEGDFSNWHYSPDMKHISFTVDVKMEETLLDKHSDLPEASGRAYDDLMVRHWTQWHDYKYSHVAYAKIENGKVSKTYTDIMASDRADSPLQPFGGGEQIAWSNDGKNIVYVSKKLVGKEYAVSTNSELYMYNLDSKKTTNLTLGNKGYDNEPVMSPAGDMIAWVAMERDGFESDKNVVWVLDLKSNKKKALTNKIDQSFGSLSWSADQKAIYATSAVNATYQLFELNLDGKTFDALQLKNVRAVTTGIHNINGCQVAGGKIIGTKNSMSVPAELFAFEIKTGKATQLSQANNEMISEMKMGKVEKRMIKTTDGKDMLTWVIYPPDFDPNQKYPTLLYCQGGPQSAVSQFFSYRWNFQLMAANGYIVVAPNRRGLPSFGQKWNDEISKDWGGQAMKDYLSAIDEVAKESYVDNDKLGAVGASYGGYSVYYLAGIHEDRFKTFISHCGLFNLESWYGTTEELFFANWDIGGPYWENIEPNSYELFSPHKLVANWNTPIMVIHNELDFRVPLNQGLEAFTAAQLKGIPSKLLYYPDEGHWVLQPQNGVMWHREFYDWLDEWLKE